MLNSSTSKMSVAPPTQQEKGREEISECGSYGGPPLSNIQW